MFYDGNGGQTFCPSFLFFIALTLLEVTELVRPFLVVSKIKRIFVSKTKG